jgi:hypothetical protein
MNEMTSNYFQSQILASLSGLLWNTTDSSHMTPLMKNASIN